ncbi:helix-turn-helix domain-containing protein [Spirosoma utsteinense]|uniref:AraC-like DNA-binding protein n=1 Tax=Spirosoma utsteinense TaxID=2585773 RepID=A0ABR6WG80_9BACT|nr:helix-turn-helix transcriptional regulator [Spirosoma utsteinense]MBC3788438.1 AraC-like DNA-binding protein [Spirosoma utsteinense]MBC3795010.1 AraC-like DNA-binding protein [Spirosoma utsteinense]
MHPSSSVAIPAKNKLEAGQLFKLSRFKELIKRTKPHKHDGYFELIILLEGAGFHWIDTQRLPVAAPVAFFLSPGQVHCWQLTTIPKGYVLLFREDFIGSVAGAELYSLLQQVEQRTEIELTDCQPVVDILHQLETEYQHPQAYSPSILRGLTQVLFARLLQAAPAETTAKVGAGAQYRQFINRLRTQESVGNRVHHYAHWLGISPQRLNALCRRVNGLSASELIDHQVILEAKRFLLHTDQTVTEIAEALRFSDPSNFVKYFKKHTGQTPTAYKKSSFI